ncbi:hypothetical protein [Adhaeribacter soli]|uniref:hypothetical protein n=1 Tax=Adhaeribacter soli TaxID=2607655 RepID=UPI00177EE358|nr:hypothetical protein [Adhaeribacter soli]
MLMLFFLAKQLFVGGVMESAEISRQKVQKLNGKVHVAFRGVFSFFFRLGGRKIVSLNSKRIALKGLALKIFILRVVMICIYSWKHPAETAGFFLPALF